MPPRTAPGAQRGGPRGGSRGRPPRGGPQRSAGAARGGTSVGPALAAPAAHVTTIGVRRPDYGQAGRVVRIQVNAFEATLPDATIHHYDEITPPTLPARFNMEIFKALQCDIAPQVFSPKVAYDGRKNVFSAHRLNFTGGADAQEFSVALAQTNGGPNPTRPPRVFKVKLTHVSQINPEILERFVQGQQSHDAEAITALTACNVALRMEPNLNFPFNIRSFFIEQLDKRNIGHGIELWRGLFQSLRPGVDRVFVNVDIATGVMYKRGSLLNLCLEILEHPNPSPNLLSPQHGLPDHMRIKVQRFITGVNVLVETTGTRKRVVRGLTKQGANQITFDNNGTQITVAQYFQNQLGHPLQFPNVICVEIGRGAIVPLEVCKVPPGQIIRKQIPPTKTTDVLAFATQKPAERFNIIRQGTQFLQYGQSEYIRSFGMSVNIAAGPLELSARVLNPPRLNYGAGSKDKFVVPRDGSWNMRDKRLYKPCPPIKQWVVIIYENKRRFGDNQCRDMIQGLVGEAKNMGITFEHADPLVRWENPGDVLNQLKSAGMAVFQKTKAGPQLFVVVLPDGGDEIYTSVKHFGDIKQGVATQCMKSSKCARAKAQYWANVLLKVNVKLGGINAILDPNAATSLADPANPTVIMGADVMHPAPGSEGRPSFTALVSSVDSHATKYVAINKVQTGRQEIIEDLKEMVVHGLKNAIDYRMNVERQGVNAKPRRLIFFRDGVSEGQFAHVLEQELPLIKAALAELGLTACNITLIVVGKRHHIRFNPIEDRDRDRSGNAPAGTVLDRGIAHPTEFDFYLLSQGGLLGTSRPSHYSVLYDENRFNADSMQALAYSLCHVYARATRSVSIPAPVYYADIVCARAKTHYDPQGRALLTDSATQTSAGAATMLENFKQHFQPLSTYAQRNMYFS